ncbi:transcription factor SPT20 homolog isoform X2 [Phymastichus coffea]|uniref:transcription factor SPT20 homolog isoform X2 n=1 Tax=Phymastichus coffea TaxID=108790 RepID=UPI00273AE804|nr:transcription factor SPT20 homolog isoform X2 [Phymastichus coffea]
MMIEPAYSLEDACRQVQPMINQISRSQRDSQSQNQGGLEITVGNLSKVVLSQKKDQAISSRQSIQCKLTKLYFEELSNGPHANSDSVLNNLENEDDLLGKLVQKDGLHTLIVNLYAGNKGYSLAVRNSGQKGLQYDKLGIASDASVGSVSETQLMGYEQGELLTCIDNGQLPGVLAEQLEANNSQLFYDGCIIAEVRDYRRVYPHNNPETHHVLLKPSTQSILSDVSALTSDGDWSHEERLVLESQIVAATQGPLCLDPNPIAGLTSSRLRQCKSLLASQQLVRQARKFSQVTLNRKRKLEQLAQPEGITIQDLMQRLRTKRTSQPCSTGSGSASFSTTVPAPCLPVPALSPPSSPIDVLRYAKAYEQPRETKDCLPQLIEEYILETERGQGRIYHIKLSILQRPSNSEYLGELYVDIDYREAEKKGSSCRFILGTRGQANHYIQQFTEIFTEEGRKNVKIQHIVPGQAPRVTCTPSMQRMHQQQQQQQQALQHQHNSNAQRLVQQVKTQLAAQHLQQSQSQRVAQQILSARTQGHLNSLSGNQLSSLAGQVANSIKAITEAAVRQQQPQQQSSQPQAQLPTVTQQPAVASLLNCLDGAVTQGLTGIVQSDDGVNLNVDQQQQVNVARIPTVGSQNLDNTAKVALSTADIAACNGSANILVFQQKAAPTTVPTASSNVSVLQAQLQSGALNSLNDDSDSDAARNSTNLAISALATSLMNSAQQFTAQQQAAQAAAAAAAAAAQAAASSTSPSPVASVLSNPAPQTAPKSNNAAILSLLNSAPANLQQKNQQSRRISLNAGSLPQRVLGQGNLITVPSTTGQVRVSFSSALTANQLAKQQPVKATAVRLARVQDPSSTLGLSMPGLSALLAGTPNEDNSVPGITAASSLFERLTASSQNQQGSQPNSPMTSPPPATPPLQQSQQQASANVNLQGVNLSGLQNPINGLQNVQMVPATIVTTAAAGNTPTVVITNPANAHLSLPIAQLIPSGVKGLTQQSIRGNSAGVTLAQGGQAIQLVGSPRSRVGQMARQVPGAQSKALPNQLMAASKTVTANQLVLSRNKQILTPIVVAASKPMLMTSQASASSSPSAISSIANKQTLLAKTLNARSAQCNAQPATLNAVAGLSPQQLQQLQQHLAAQQQQKAAGASALANPIRAQIQPRGSGTGPTISDDLL